VTNDMRSTVRLRGGSKTYDEGAAAVNALRDQLSTTRGTEQRKGEMSRHRGERTHLALEFLQEAVAPARKRVITHPLYSSLNNPSAILTFMEHHVFAVWDFMSLLKSLQRNLTCVTVPWVPVGPTGTRRLINDIVLGEESDEVAGAYLSHFEWYVAGMAEAGADHSVVDRFIALLGAQEPVPAALQTACVPRPSAEFVGATWGFIESAPVHCQAAAFAFGREDLIPEMFNQVVAVNQQKGGLETFVDYLERHIAVDGEQHTPMAMQMVANLCGEDETKWGQCIGAVNTALAARSRLWDGILTAINSERVIAGAACPG
jgi:hypothetical protein